MFGGPRERRLPAMQSNPNQRSDMQQSRNIAARAGRWSARHRKTAVLGWIVFVVLAFMVGSNIGTRHLTHEESGVGDSGRAAQITKDAYPDAIGRDGPHPEQEA